jgi:hypothetical protein
MQPLKLLFAAPLRLPRETKASFEAELGHIVGALGNRIGISMVNESITQCSKMACRTPFFVSQCGPLTPAIASNKGLILQHQRIARILSWRRFASAA